MPEKNTEKYERYKGQMGRLDLAIENKCYLEAIFIEYAIIEDRTWSALKHAGIEGCAKTDGLDRRLDALKELAKSDELAKKHLPSKLIGDVKCWKNDRNKYVHNLMEVEMTTSKLRGLAVRGRRLIGEFGGKVASYNRAVGRRNKV